MSPQKDRSKDTQTYANIKQIMLPETVPSVQLISLWHIFSYIIISSVNALKKSNYFLKYCGDNRTKEE